MAGKYRLHRSGSQFHWDLKAGNGEPILSSERYISKQSALNGIQSCRENSPLDARYERRTGVNGQAYFVLKASNGETIGTSEMYSSIAARDNGIASCKQNGPTAPVEDNT
jgi:uncharacterized protein YegP (UPF0339 family)